MEALRILLSYAQCEQDNIVYNIETEQSIKLLEHNNIYYNLRFISICSNCCRCFTFKR